MHTSLLLCALVGTMAMPGAAGSSHSTIVEVRLLTSVSTYSSKPGDRIEALLATPVCAQERRVLPDGTIFRGVLKTVRKVGLGLIHETAGLEIEFRELRLPDGRSYPVGQGRALQKAGNGPAPFTVQVRLVDVDSARERVDGRGAIHGIRATGTLSNRLGERLAFAALDHPFLLIPVFTIASGLVRFPDPEIQYGRGTALDLKVRLPASFGAVAPCAVPEPASTAGLAQLVDGLPAWTYSKRQRQPIDPITLVLVGSREEVERAFAAAGWDGSRQVSIRAGLDAVRAIAEDNSYDDAPMRTLLLDGAEPDFSFQKALNTFSKRHHLRAWRRPETWEGRTVWASAATQDIGITFSLRPFGFTHEIENEVDREREKAIGDLVFCGCVDSVAYIPRTTALRDSGNYRKGIISDSRVAVVVLNSCRAPRRDFENAEFDSPPAARPGIAVRSIRRFTLTVRNHFLRDNVVWRCADAARLGVLAVRHWNEQRKDERQARSENAVLKTAPAAPLPEPAQPAAECRVCSAGSPK